MPRQTTFPEPPEGVLACGCTTDVIERLYEQSGIARPDHHSRDHWALIEGHVEPHLGPFLGALHDGEGTADGTAGVSIDVLIHGPSTESPTLDLVTAGMSVRRMRAPRAYRRCGGAERAELAFRLPASWGDGPLSFEGLLRPEHRWVLQWLALLSRLPFCVDACFGDHASLPIESRCAPFEGGGGGPFRGVLFADPARFGRAIPPLATVPGSGGRRAVSNRDGDTAMARAARPRDRIRFVVLVPIHGSEFEFVLEHGVEHLFRRLAAAGVTDVVDLKRASVV